MAKKTSLYTQAVEQRAEKTPQSSVLPGREPEMVENLAGGWTFELSPAQTVARFLILGSDQGTYYADPKAHTEHNMDRVRRAIAEDPAGVLKMVLDINLGGRAQKVDQSLLVYSMLLNNKSIAEQAYGSFNDVIRIGTHLFTLAEFMKAQKAFGSRARKAFASWYTMRGDVDAVARQVSKYQNRNQWRHKDVFRLCHINPTNMPLNWQATFRWASGQPMTEHKVTRKNKADSIEVRPDLTEHLPPILQGYELAKKATTAEEVIALIQKYGLEREHIPTQWLNTKEVWKYLVFNMKVTALIRNVNKMTAVGLFEDQELVQYVASRITDAEKLKKERVHPLTVLLAAKVYYQGKGILGDLEWTPVKGIIQALDSAFYLAFGAVVPVNKPVLFSMDVSGSMWMRNLFTWQERKGQLESVDLPLKPVELEAAMALVMARTEPKITFGVFETTYHEAVIDPNWTLGEVTAWIQHFNYGGTDCAQPFLHAMGKRMDVGAFITTTDGDTWAGNVHPSEAFKQYRARMNKPDVRSVIVATNATAFSLSDPKEPAMLDVAGFDTEMFTTISEFVRGEI